MEKDLLKRYSYFFNGHTYNELSKQALNDILQSGLTPETLEYAQVKLYNGTLENLKNTLELKSIEDLKDRILIEFPYFNEKEKIILKRYKIVPPVIKGKNTIKYLHPSGIPPIPYILPVVWEIKDKPHKPLWFTEGEKKALKVMQHDRHCIAFSGVWNFKAGKQSSEFESKYLWKELEMFNLKGRHVFLAFDNDLWVNRNVRLALFELAFKLYERGAIVNVTGWSGAKGIDDYLTLKELEDVDVKKEIENLERIAVEIHDFINPGVNSIDEIIRAVAIADVSSMNLERTLRVLRDKYKLPLRSIEKEFNRIKQEISDLLDEDKESVEKLQKLCKMNYTPVLPPNFKIHDKFLYEIKKIQGVDFPVCVSYAVCIDAHIKSSEPKLLFKTLNGKSIVADITISDSKEFDKVFSKFLDQPLDKESIKSLQRYIKVYYMLNKDKLVSLDGVSQTGWYQDKFLLPTRKIKGIAWDSDAEFICEAITQKGSKKEQFEMLKKVLHIPAGVCVLAGLSAPLLKILDIPNYIVNLTGLMARGKSTIAGFNASLWGNPNMLKGSWFSTKVGFELFASMWKDMPVWLDDFEHAGKEQNKIIDFIYQYHTGFGKLRSSRDVKLRKIFRFKGVLITTSESDIESIVSSVLSVRTKPRGMFRRVIEIPITENSYKFIDSDEVIDARMLNIFMNSNYGWVAPEWIQWIEQNIDKITETYAQFYDLIVELGILNGSESAYSVLLATSKLLDEFLDLEVINEEGEQVGSLLREYIYELIGVHDERLKEVSDIVEDVKSALVDVIKMNKDKFYGVVEDTSKMRSEWGEVYTDTGDVFILSTVFEQEVCRKYGIVKRQALSELKKYGVLYIQGSRQKDSKRFVIKRRLGGQIVSGYYFKNIFEPVEDEKDDMFKF